jgi:hypothetical protein
MNSNQSVPILRRAALVVGFSLLIMTAAAIFAQSVVSSSNPSPLLQYAVLAFMVVIVMDITVAWGLYVFFKPVNQQISFIGAVLRTVYAVIFAFALSSLFIFLGRDINMIQNMQMSNRLDSFNHLWQMGLFVFSIHLGVIGYLVLKSTFVPKYLGILLLIAGVGYMIDSIGKTLIADYTLTISAFTFIGELVLMIWMLVKGGKQREINVA